MFDTLPSFLSFELSDRCNAACPMCARINPETGKESVYVKYSETSSKLFKASVSDQYIKQSNLHAVTFCGNYGDPIVARDVFDIVKYLSIRKIQIFISTNGAFRNSEWWLELGKVLALSPKHKITFGIDGTDQATHGYYRRFTDYNKVLSNLRSFIAGGGRAEWQFIVFRHNEHQLAEAKRLASSLGCISFRELLSPRFYSKKMTFVDRTGKIGLLEQPDYARQKYAIIENKVNSLREIRSHQQSTRGIVLSTRCLAKQKNQAYISAEGYVFPCCFTAADFMRKRETFTASGREAFLESELEYPWSSEVNIRSKPIDEILKHPFFSQFNRSLDGNPMNQCVKTCHLDLRNAREKDPDSGYLKL